MVKYLILVISAMLVASAFADQSSGSCPGGRKTGEQFDQGRYWYECQADGTVAPKGCLSEDSQRVPVGGTYDTKQYRMQCIMGPDGFLTVSYQACISEGSEHDVGSQWDDGTAFYNCIKEGNNVRVVTLGCVDDARHLKLDERVAKGDFVYQCRKNSAGTPTVNKVGCVYNDKKYTIGETFDGTISYYTCTDSGPQAIGCLHNGNRMKWGDSIDQDDVRYLCQSSGKESTFTAHGCLQRDQGAVIERKIGCFFTEDSYEYTCKDDGNGKATKVPVQCAYFRNGDGAGFKLRPGCIRLADGMAVGCVQNGEKLSLQTYSADQLNSVPGLSRSQC